MKWSQNPVVLVVVLLALGSSVPAYCQDLLEISEFMAVNDTGLDDADRDESDWIEIHNAGADRANLQGWYLTDSAGNLAKWQFPEVFLDPDAYLVVFASGKDRRDPAGELHTDFKLSGSGEYLGLVRPDGVTVVSEFSPAFPPQAPDVSYGLVETIVQESLLVHGTPARAFVPLDDSLEPPSVSQDAPRPWTLENFDDTAWPSGVTGVGFGYGPLVGLNVSDMRNVNETVYVRIPFVVDDPSAFKALMLRVQFDDGMIAYLNGHEVARDNAPETTMETWNSGAVVTWPNSRLMETVDFPIRQMDYLHVGTNVLAIHGLNHGLASPDLLVNPELLATVAGMEPSRRYFPKPTPGGANNAGVETVGPIIADMEHSPETPTERDTLWITARISPAFDPVALVELRYRVMFEPENTIALRDDGRGGDNTPGDGIYTAAIPEDAFTAGDMVRWYILAVDTAGRMSRLPAFRDPLGSPQYDGTVVENPSLKNPLPVLHWFVQNPSAASSDAGTRCSIFYDGEFYDNIWAGLHGQSSRGFPKKSYNIDFHPGYNFKWADGQPRADDINLLTTYPDKAQMRNILAYETYRDADCAYHWAFAVRVQQNGAFWGTAHVVENGDRDWLVRMGLNAEGALYKMYNSFTSAGDATSGAEKKTRKNEANADLLALFNGISLTGEARRRYVYDNVDVAQVVNFLAARAITGDTDCCHKNYYFYRDTGFSNEWQMWPWDVDLSFGRRWISSMTYWDQRLIADTPLFVGNNNRMPQTIFGTPEMRQMYLRRVRTLMDELLMPPGTAQENLHYEPRIDELAAQIGPDAILDAAKWNSHAWGNGSTAPNYPQPYADAVAEMRNSYLPERRRQLFNRLTSGSAELPTAQPAGTAILFGDINAASSARNQDEEYIQLLNPNAFAVDISRWLLSTDADPGTPLFVFRGGTVIPANGTLYVVASRPAFRARATAPKGGQGLFITGDYAGRLSKHGETLTLTDRQGLQVASINTR
ncbi:MAG TPA: CotH kinase family protein [Sedimentisphaerales bacterium]|jgi:hypothetical protein|nr:CotH kinase family protein [Sedimentisphaerales bacterium]HNU29196.1 CotH kinase family protein [Sedimentisphaerales bacterium]